MKHLNHNAFVLACLLGASLASAGELKFTLAADKADALYAVDEPITFTTQLFEDDKPVEGKSLKWICKGDDGQESSGEAKSSAEPLVVKTSLKKPGFVRLTVTLVDDDGKPVKAAKGNGNVVADGGAGADVHQIQPAPEPADFDAFWAKQKEALAAVPMKATMTPVEAKNKDFDAFDVKVDCAGPRPVSGYLTKPKNAKPKSLPAVVSFHGYGIRSASVQTRPGALVLDINAHGIENGQPPEFYKALADGELKNYAFVGNDKPETSYYLGMYHRVLRALEFVKSQGEWDGKNLEVVGGSQGGLQAIVAAGLDPDVSLCMASKPWSCDFAGPSLGRMTGWRPQLTPALLYFDAAYFAKRIKTATVIADAGLGDYVCPPSSITAMFNGVPSPQKKLIYIQAATHPTNPPGARTMWNESELRKAALRK